MVPGRGYVLQLGGNGNHSEFGARPELFNFSGGSDNDGTITTGVTANTFALLGNPYNNFLDLDLFLLNSTNAGKLTGTVYLWSHNTIVAPQNINPNDPNYYVNSANDYSLYNVLGGVAAGRSISTSSDNGTSTGIQTPNGKICFGTGFGVVGSSSGNIVYENSMRTSSNGGETQSFRLINQNTDANGNKTTSTPSVRSRIWVNLEKGTPPSSGINNNPLKQLLVGYSPCYGSECATTGDNDRIFDAATVTAISNPYIDFYSFAASSTKKLAIQGRGDFQKYDSFQLGYKATDAGTYTFTSTADGIFTTQPYYILDVNDGIYHTLPYSFTTAAGTFNARFKVVFENLTSVVGYPVTCGTTLANIATTIYSIQVSGATSYKFEVRNNSNNLVGEYDGNGTYPYQFNLNIAGAIAYNTTYVIRVATYQVNGLWAYGPPCTVTTPAPPTASLSSSCGTTITNAWSTLYAGSPSELGYSTTGWHFEVSTSPLFGTILGSIDRTNANFALAQVISPVQGTTYYVRVQIKFNNVWQVDASSNPIYGAVCAVTYAGPRGIANNDTYFAAKANPNPFSGDFNLNVDSVKEEAIEIRVYDIFGRQMEMHTGTPAEIENLKVGAILQSGVYSVIVKQGENIQTLRIIKR